MHEELCREEVVICLIMIGGTKGPCISARANQKRSRRLEQKFHAYQAATGGWKSDQIRLETLIF